ncbi:unnamed protein product [marine sediment metagenome]|uniref:Uncharacterized protein n=1 Tax=marine sediment metagenome TaxID=412755 RepID=X1DKA3_9ZZZZ
MTKNSENNFAYFSFSDVLLKTISPVYQQYREIFAATMQGIFIGELTVEEGLDIVVQKVNKLLDDYYEENPVK